MPGEDAVRGIADLLFRRGAGRRSAAPQPQPPVVASPPDTDPVFPTKAFRKFLSCLALQPSPSLIDLGAVVGSNVNFFGDRLGCKIYIEDLVSDVERLTREGRISQLPTFLKTRFRQPEASVDGILCWDIFDYMDRAAAQVLGRQLSRLLRPGGALLGFFSTIENPVLHYTRYVIVDDFNLRHKPYAASRGRQAVMLNRDIIKLFDGLIVSDSFLLKVNTREILFRKQAFSGALRDSS